VASCDLFVGQHYRYSRFRRNLVITLLWAVPALSLAREVWTAPVGWTDYVTLVLAVVFFLSSRDTL
jgi:hypothetical protein